MIKPFQLIAGNVALDLINTLDNRFRGSGPEDLLVDYDDLLRFVAQAGLLTAVQIRRLRRLTGMDAERARVLTRVKNLRETLAAVAYALVDGEEVAAADLQLLEKFFRQASANRRLIAEGSRLMWRWKFDRDLTSPWRLLAQEAADFLLSERVTLLRCCSSDACRWLFLDTSKNHTRRWCDMKICGNRMKARRFQARRLSK